MKRLNQLRIQLLFLVFGLLLISCQEDESYPRTRLFKPVLNEDLSSVDNTIIVDIARSKQTISYTLEVSEDSFATIEYTVDVDTSYIVINSDLVGEELLWNSIYQVRVTAHADDSEYDSKVADFGSVRTQKYPSNLNEPSTSDVIDDAAQVSWVRTGDAITQVKVFAEKDKRLENPLMELTVSEEEEAEGIKIVNDLSPVTTYQIAIYSGDELRGWTNYTTIELAIDPSDPNVIDLSESDDPDALAAAVAAAASGNLILIKKGVQYNMPTEGLNKSLTIHGDLGFTERQATIFVSGNWNIQDGAVIDYIRFEDVEIAGEKFDGSYVFNIDKSGTIGELSFSGCYIHNLRGVLRMKSGSGTISDYKVYNSIVDSVRDYAVMNVDAVTWAVENISLENSTFSHIQQFLVSKNNSNSLDIESCTLYAVPAAANYMLRWRESGQDNILNGVTISNTIIGAGWDYTESGVTDIAGIQGLASTILTTVNVWTTSEYNATTEITGIGSQDYSGTATDLWVDPEHLDFNFSDTGFSGRTSSGDPRWRTEL